jgi:tetratricopeptide (TPR) repeat protein
MKMASCAALGLFACLAATLLGTGGCGPVVGEINQDGLKEYNAGRYIEAIGFFKTALNKDITRPETLYYLGRAYVGLAEDRFRAGNARMGRRNLDDAIYYFDRAINAFPGYEEAVQGKKRALELRGEYDKAIAVLKESERLLGASAKSRIQIAQDYEQRGDTDNALLAYRQAVALEPLDAVAHAELGRFYKRIGRKDDAIAELTRAHRLNADRADVVGDLQALGAWPLP